MEQWGRTPPLLVWGQMWNKSRAILLLRTGQIFLSASQIKERRENGAVALNAELTELGYVASSKLTEAFSTLDGEALKATHSFLLDTLNAHLGANQRHVPLFRRFPEGVPDDTTELWWSRVLTHFLQQPNQPCLHCEKEGRTLVLTPCGHVVCDFCFDVDNYSGCPVCGHQLQGESSFVRPSAAPPPLQAVTRAKPLKLLTLGNDLRAAARDLVQRLLARPQALTPDDKDALVTLVREHGNEALEWAPSEIPLRENIATFFGVLLQTLPDEKILEAAESHVTTATDVLRLIAAFSDADAALQGQILVKTINGPDPRHRFWSKIEAMLGLKPGQPTPLRVNVPVKVNRFKVRRLSRPLRRALLQKLETLPKESLFEDMLRHRSYWVWLGEFLHPHEYAKRFPTVAAAFHLVRKKSPQGVIAPKFQSWNGRVEAAANDQDAKIMLETLQARPGELARRLDHLLRMSDGDPSLQETVANSFIQNLDKYAVPVLVTLLHLIPTRTQRAAVRIYWPKGTTAKGISAPDERLLLPEALVSSLASKIREELLRRFSALARKDTFLVDKKLCEIAAPFNERTASSSAVALPRGSTIPVPETKLARLFLHWCEPENGGSTTDLDLSVGFYAEDWSYQGVCSYYELKLRRDSGSTIATSAGDFTSAPFPNGSSEFIDIDREEALKNGMRYAVMVVNSYSGMAFSQLDRAFAGLMLRDSSDGKHFDPQAVELKFDLQGENGVYLPMVFDMQENKLHWLDTYNKGQFALNNVATSNSVIQKICPEMITYFGSGVRASMLDLVLLHAASRTDVVHLRDDGTREVCRLAGESDLEFHGRLVEAAAEPGAEGATPELPKNSLAALYRGNVTLPEGTECYALFRERVRPTLGAGDFLSTGD